MTKPRQVPEGYTTVTPCVVTKDTRRLLEFIKQAFDAEELGRVEVEGGARSVCRRSARQKPNQHHEALTRSDPKAAARRT
jgi:uncharacterized glyoxalase superfamily protein PhnB